MMDEFDRYEALPLMVILDLFEEQTFSLTCGRCFAFEAACCWLAPPTLGCTCLESMSQDSEQEPESRLFFEQDTSSFVGCGSSHEGSSAVAASSSAALLV